MLNTHPLITCFYASIRKTHGLLSSWPCSLAGSQGREFESHPGQSFSLPLCGSISLPGANTQIG